LGSLGTGDRLARDAPEELDVLLDDDLGGPDEIGGDRHLS
jgi:hypothetical protein